MKPTWLLLGAHVPADGQGGGMVRYAVEFAKALSASGAAELHVTSAPQAVAFWETIVEPEHVHPMVYAPVAARSWMERHGRGCKAFEQSFDVVHGAKHLIPTDVPGTSVLTVHDFLPLDRPVDFGPLKRALLPRPYLASIREADALVCVSEATRDRLISYVPEARSRAHVVPLAGSSLNSEVSQSIPELQDRNFALVVGDDSSRKNVEFVIDLWESVADRQPGSVLALAGPTSWKSASRSEPEHPDVVHLGYLPQSQLAWAYRNASVVLCPSLLEGFGLPAREAVDLQAPLITSEDPALCEVSGLNAVHVPAFDGDAWVKAICTSLGDSRPRVSAQNESRTWSDVAQQTVEVVDSVFDRAVG